MPFFSRALLTSSLLAAMVFVAACSSDGGAKSPPLADCTGRCSPSDGPTGEGAGGSSAGAGGSAGEAGSAGSVVEPVTVTGVVEMASDSEFLTSTVYPSTATVSASPAANPALPSSALWNGSGLFTLDNVAPGLVWLTAAPTSTTVFRGAQLIDVPASSGLADASVRVVPIEFIQSIFLQVPSLEPFDESAGHVVLRFVDSSGNPLQGVTVSSNFAAQITYDDGPGYGKSSTGGRGVALFLNAHAAVPSTIRWTTPAGDTGSLDMLVESQLVSFATLALD